MSTIEYLYLHIDTLTMSKACGAGYYEMREVLDELVAFLSACSYITFGYHQLASGSRIVNGGCETSRIQEAGWFWIPCDTYESFQVAYDVVHGST